MRPDELTHHSDARTQRGFACTSIRLAQRPVEEGIRPSIVSVGDAYHNALMESISGVNKAECFRTTIFHDGPHKTIADVVKRPRFDAASF